MLLFIIIPLVLIGVSLAIYFLFIKKSSKKSTETFSDLITDTQYPAVSRTYLTSVSLNTINGSGTCIKTLDTDNILSIQVEANLPLGIGGDFNNENVIYRVFTQDNKPLMSLSRLPDGFYRGLYTLSDSSASDFSSISSIIVTASDESGDTPVLSGSF